MIILSEIVMFLLGFICWVFIGIGVIGILVGMLAYKDDETVAYKVLDIVADECSYSWVLAIIDFILWPIMGLRIWFLYRNKALDMLEESEEN